MAEIIDAEPNEVRHMAMPERRLAVVSETVALPVPVDEAIAQWTQYQELVRRLLDDSDYQAAPGGKKFKKKSAWRKLARAFNITDRVVFEEIHRSADGFPMWARVRVEAAASNGRTSEADHECHISERCCEAAQGLACPKKGWSKHTCCAPGCSGRMHWSHPGDISATATTRAKNRAISDLIGAGEVSAEEMEREDSQPPAAPPPARSAPAPRRATESRAPSEYGWDAGNAPPATGAASPPDDEGLVSQDPGPERQHRLELEATWRRLLGDAKKLGIPVVDITVSQAETAALEVLVSDLRLAVTAAPGHGQPVGTVPPTCGCGNPREYVTGESNGRQWKGWFCPTKRDKGVKAPAGCEPKWVND